MPGWKPGALPLGYARKMVRPEGLEPSQWVGPAGVEPATFGVKARYASNCVTVPARYVFLLEKCLLLWQFAHRTSHFSISAKILFHL